jgi:hypothetical protein
VGNKITDCSFGCFIITRVGYFRGRVRSGGTTSLPSQKRINLQSQLVLMMSCYINSSNMAAYDGDKVIIQYSRFRLCRSINDIINEMQ